MALSSSFPQPDELKGAAWGTLLYLTLYFGFLIPFQSFSKFYLLNEKRKQELHHVSLSEVKYYNRDDKLALCGDRSVGNFVEFSILFLPLAWMRILLVTTQHAFWIFCIYTAARALYPFVFATRYDVCSTVPGYLVLIYLMIHIALHLP